MNEEPQEAGQRVRTGFGTRAAKIFRAKYRQWFSSYPPAPDDRLTTQLRLIIDLQRPGERWSNEDWARELRKIETMDRIRRAAWLRGERVL